MQPTIFLKNASQQGLPMGAAIKANPLVVYRGLGMSVGNMAVLTGAQGRPRETEEGKKLRSLKARESESVIAPPEEESKGAVSLY